MSIGRKNENIFCFCALIFMLLQFLVFYVGMHLEAVLLAFQEFNPATESMQYLPFSRLFENFVNFIKDLFGGSDLGMYFRNGALFHLMTLVMMPLSLSISFIIVKKLPLTGFFKVTLFIPNVLSTMVLAMLFRYLMLDGYRAVWMNILNKPYIDFPAPLVNEKYALQTLLWYTIFLAIPGNLLINIGTMSRVPEDLIEYGKLEGMSYLQEFYYVILPLMFPTLQVYCLGMFVGFFTAEGPLYAIYGAGNSTKMYLPNNAKTLGYHMFVSVIADSGSGLDKRFMYGYTSAANLLIGLVSIPIVYGTKKLFDLFDPNAEF